MTQPKHIASNIRRLKRWSGTSVLALASACASAAMAQGANSPHDETSLEQIVVTARKRSENLQETPVAVSAVSGERLDEQGIRRIDDLVQAVPSLNITALASYSGIAIIGLRGIVKADPVLTSEMPTALYYDGVYIGHGVGGLLSVSDLERVEVLRGPQGTLNGRNSTAGSISLFSKKPAETFGVEQRLSYGTFNNFISRTAIDTGLIGDTGISARLAYRFQHSDGSVHNTLVDRSKGPGAINAQAVVATVHADLTDDIQVDYHFDYDFEKNVPTNVQVVSGNTLFVNYFGASAANGGAPFAVQGAPLAPGIVSVSPDRLSTVQLKYWGASRLKVQGHGLTLNGKLSDNLSMKSITAYRKNYSRNANVIGSYGQLRAPAGLNTVGTTVRDVDLQVIPSTPYSYRGWSQEFQLSGKFDEIEFVGGLYYYSEKFHQSYAAPGALSTRAVTATSGIYTFGTSFLDYSGKVKSKAAYSQVSYSPSALDNKLELTVGARYTEDSKRLDQTQPASLVRSLRRKDHNLSGEASVKYKWTPDVMTYFRVAQAYNSGGFNPRDNVSVSGYGPEKLVSYELGVKADLFDRHARLNANVYHSDYKDLQVAQGFANSAATPCPLVLCTTVVNAGRATYDGVEIEAVVIPTRGLQISGNLGYVHPKYKEFFSTPTTNIAGLPGIHFTSVSKLTATASVQYAFEPTSIGELRVRASWDYHSKRWFAINEATAPNARFTTDPGFHNITAQIILANIPKGSLPGEYELKVYGSNLLNNYPVLQGLDLSTYGYRSFGAGRTFGVELTGRF